GLLEGGERIRLRCGPVIQFRWGRFASLLPLLRGRPVRQPATGEAHYPVDVMRGVTAELASKFDVVAFGVFDLRRVAVQFDRLRKPPEGLVSAAAVDDEGRRWDAVGGERTVQPFADALALAGEVFP